MIDHIGGTCPVPADRPVLVDLGDGETHLVQYDLAGADAVRKLTSMGYTFENGAWLCRWAA